MLYQKNDFHILIKNNNNIFIHLKKKKVKMYIYKRIKFLSNASNRRQILNKK